MSGSERPFSLDNALGSIRKHMRQAEHLFMNELLLASTGLYGEDRQRSDRASLAYHSEGAWRTLLAVCEHTEQRNLFEDAKAALATCRTDFSNYEMGNEEPYLVSNDRLEMCLGVIEDLYPLADSKIARRLDDLIRTIEGLAHYLTDLDVFGWLPAREEDVHRRIEAVLRCHYADLKHKPPLTRLPIKNFQPDTAVPSLKCLIEYKFIETAAKAATVIDELNADIAGYQNPEYQTFVFVLYETRPIHPQAHWEAAIRAKTGAARVEVRVLTGREPTDEDKRISLSTASSRRPRSTLKPK